MTPTKKSARDGEEKEVKVEKEKSVPAGGDRDKAFDGLVSSLQEKFGEGSLMKLGETRRVNIPAIPSGSFSLDLALGVGGFPRGRIVEIFGPESSGKTTLALNVVAQAQKQGGRAAFIDWSVSGANAASSSRVEIGFIFARKSH